MKKLVTLLSLAAVITGAGTATMLHSKADMKTETASFSVSADRSRKPSAYCRKSDGSPVGNEFSSSDNFCIPASAQGNMNMLSSDGLPAYCIGSHRQNSPVSLTQVTKLSDIPYDSEQYGAVFRMASAGASSRTSEYGLSDEDLYYVTQCAIRGWLYGIDSEELAFFYEDGSLSTEMTSEFMRISEAAYQEPQVTDASLAIDDTDSFTEKIYVDSQCYFRYGPFHPHSDYTDIDRYTVSLNGDENQVIVSPFYDLLDTSSRYEYSADYAFYVYINSGYHDEISLEISSEAVVRHSSPTVYLSSDENIQDIFQLYITDTQETLSGELKLKNTDTTGDLQLYKKFLAGDKEITDTVLNSQPRFTVKNEKGKYVSGIQASGQIVFDHFSDEPVEYALTSESVIYISGLPTGEYTIFEIKGAEGYEAREQEIIINNTYELNTCVFVNESVTTTTTTPVTTTITTTAETTTVTTPETSETTTAMQFTITLPKETPYATEITESYETETVTSETTVSETTEESSETTTSQSKRASSLRLTSTPKTGDNRPLAMITLIMATALGTAVSLRKKY